MKTKSLIRSLVVMGGALLLPSQALATTNVYSIGINFASDQLVWDYAAGAAGGSSDLAPEDLAGIPGVQQKNWNNALDTGTGAAFNPYPTPATFDNLVADDRGTAAPTTASVTWLAQGTWSTSGSRGVAENNGTNFFPNTPDNKLMTGYLDTTAGASPTLITITNIPPELLSGAYNVFVYSMGGAFNANRGGSIRVIDASSGTPLTPDKLITSPVTTRPTAYVEDLGVNHTDNGIYVRFNGIAASSITIEATIGRNPNNATPRANVNAVQLVAAGLTEPIVNGVVGNGQGFSFTISDLPTALLDTATVTVQLDGASTNIPVVVGTKASGLTPVRYDILADKGIFFASGSSHTNVITFKDTTGRTFTATRTFTVPAYTTINSAFAVAAVDTTKPGFRIKVHQMDINRNPQTGVVPNAERQIANGYIDPATGQPYPNTAELAGADADGYLIEPEVINYNQDAPTAGGNFSSASTPPFEDKPVPGISGTGANLNDRYVQSVETFLELKPGLYRFGVNSDDGFRLSFGRGPGDVAGTQLATAGDRGFANTTADFIITQQGFYPVRVMWWETGGGSGAEFFRQDIASGAFTLINDLTAADPIKAYRESAASRPYVSRSLPSVGYAYGIADQDLVIDITDGAIPVDQASIRLLLNNNAVTVTPSKAGKVTTLRRVGGLSNLLPSGANNVSVIYGFTEGGSTVTVTNNYTYTVPAYTRPIPPANRVPVAQVSGAGFRVKSHQFDRSLDANQGNGGRYPGNGGGANNMPRPEIQLSNGYINRTNNQPFPNLITPGPNADGSYDISDVLNFNNAASAGGPAANAGIFNTDTQTPGLPGTGTSNFSLDNSVHEVTTYLDLKAGAYLFGLNVDDGFICISAPNVQDTLGTLLGIRNPGGGQNANLSANAGAAFNVIVAEDGIYPFRILWWQGGGGVNMEFLTVDRNTGSQALVNDTTGAVPSVVALSGNLNSPITAYNTYTGPVRPWVKFSVYPMPSAYQNQHQQSGPGPILVKLGAANAPDFANDNPANRPWADGIGAVFANLGSETPVMQLGGTNVTPTITQSGSDTVLRYTPSTPLPSASTQTASLIYAGVTNSWTFIVQTYTNLAASAALPSSQADPASRGFRAKVVQAAAARAGGNTVVAAETQLAGTPANIAMTGPNSDGTYTIPGILNWNVTKAPGGTPTEKGSFQPILGFAADDTVPGIPGTGLTGAARFENVAAEIVAYLDLPAGYQKFGISGDDGWAASVATAGVTNGMVLFSINRGADTADTPFSFVTPQAGLYPVRIVWYQGGGGGNLEFFTYGPAGEKIPVNADRPDAIKAYYALGGTGDTPKITTVTTASGQLTIVWTGGGTLESSPVLPATTWTTTGDSDGSFTEATAGGAKYYRVRR